MGGLSVTQATTPRRHTLRDAVLDAISAELDRDASVIVIGQDVGQFGGPLRSTEGLLDRFGPSRVMEMPICEASMTGLGVGAAMNGCRPIIEIMFGDMLTLVLTDLLQQAAAMRYMTAGRATAPLVVRTRAGDGPYRAHPQHLEALFGHLPGMTVVMPSTPADAAGLMRAAVRSDDPVLFIENIFLYNGPRQDVPFGDHVVELGTAHVVRPGSDVTLVTYGRPVRTAMTAAAHCAKTGVDVEVIDLRTVVPFDRESVIASVAKTRRLVVAHEAWVRGGIGAEVAACVSEELGDQLRARVIRLGAPDIPIPYAKPLRDATLITADQLVRAVNQVMVGRG